MILWPVLIIAVIFTIIAIPLCDMYDFEGFAFLTLAISIIAWIASGVMGIAAISNNINVDGDLAKYQARRESIIYQLEHVKYDNDNDIGMRELYEQARNFNEDVAYSKKAAHNKMISLFYPKKLYDNIELIELPEDEYGTE